MTPISFISQYFYKYKTEKVKAKALQGLGRQDWLKSYLFPPEGRICQHQQSLTGSKGEGPTGRWEPAILTVHQGQALLHHCILTHLCAFLSIITI